ncbi:hypothetical protein ACHAC9_15225 [Massilia sp. CMS3.1]
MTILVGQAARALVRKSTLLLSVWSVAKGKIKAREQKSNAGKAGAASEPF